MDPNCIDVVVTDKIVFLPGGLFENIFKLRFACFIRFINFLISSISAGLLSGRGISS